MRSIMTIETPYDLQQQLSVRIKGLRLLRNWTQKTLSHYAGVSFRTVQNAENNGNITITSLLKIASALGYLADFNNIFLPPEIDSLSQVLAAPKRRQRARES